MIRGRKERGREGEEDDESSGVAATVTSSASSLFSQFHSTFAFCLSVCLSIQDTTLCFFFFLISSSHPPIRRRFFSGHEAFFPLELVRAAPGGGGCVHLQPALPILCRYLLCSSSSFFVVSGRVGAMRAGE